MSSVYLAPEETNSQICQKNWNFEFQKEMFWLFLFEVLCFVILNFTYVHDLKNDRLNKIKEGSIQVE